MPLISSMNSQLKPSTRTVKSRPSEGAHSNTWRSASPPAIAGYSDSVSNRHASAAHVISHAARLRPRPRSTNTTRLATNGSQRIAFGTTWSGIGHRSDARRPARRDRKSTRELQSLMRISYAVFCLKKKKHAQEQHKKPPRLHEKITQEHQNIQNTN